jgi:hypothetical protein
MTLMPGLQLGDKVFVRGWPPQSLEVIDCSNRSIVVLRSDNGAVIKVGRMSVVLVENEPRVGQPANGCTKGL